MKSIVQTTESKLAIVCSLLILAACVSGCQSSSSQATSGSVPATNAAGGVLPQSQQAQEQTAVAQQEAQQAAMQLKSQQTPHPTGPPAGATQ